MRFRWFFVATKVTNSILGDEILRQERSFAVIYFFQKELRAFQFIFLVIIRNVDLLVAMKQQVRFQFFNYCHYSVSVVSLLSRVISLLLKVRFLHSLID